MTPTIKLNDKIKAIGGKTWHPIEVACLNGQVIRLALFKGKYHWHKHADKDELIFVYKGRIVVQFKDRPNAGHINAESGWTSFPLLLSDVKGSLKRQT